MSDSITTALRGAALLTTPLLNKGTAFSLAERDALGLHGLLPPHVLTLEDQLVRNYEAYQRCATDLDRHVFLRELQDRNEILFCALLRRHIVEMLPKVYAPVVAEGCRHFSHIYRKPRGLFLSYPHRKRLREMLGNRINRRVDVIVVTDGERVLGIGDQGVGGMGIPIGKLTLYTLLGGVHPGRVLPVLLDVGTNNLELRNDPLYLGWRHERIDGDEYWEFIEEFVQAVTAELPGVLLQWEDFAKPHARPILDRYADRLCTFNDDIQGTAAVALGTVQAALVATGRRLSQQRVAVLGAGGAGTGIADYLVAAMHDEGLSEAEALSRLYLVDAQGLLREELRATLAPAQARYVKSDAELASWHRKSARYLDLHDVVANAGITILLGTSAQPGLFTQAVVRQMAANTPRPLIFPLSNPTERAEARPEDVLHWTQGRALVATGSPFPAVDYGGRSVPIPQSNNLYIFPAVGLACAATPIARISDGMLRAAAAELAECAPAKQDADAPLLPPLNGIEAVSRRLAFAIVRAAQREGLAAAMSEETLRARIDACFWQPQYAAIAAA